MNLVVEILTSRNEVTKLSELKQEPVVTNDTVYA